VIAAACDIRIAAESAKIAFLFTRVGLSGADMGAAWLLPRIVGLRPCDGAAADWRLRRRQARVRDRPLQPRRGAGTGAARWAGPSRSSWARGPSAALGVTKQALEAEAALDFEAALAYEAEVQAQLMQGSNFREAHEAFRVKRDPKFT